MSPWIPALCTGLGVLFLAALALGDQTIPPLDVIGALIGEEGPTGIIVTQLRLPRAIIGAIVGAALGLAGAVCQTIMRNPLADPGIIGINAGAALAATLVIVEIGSLPESILPVASFTGALAATVGIFALSWRNGTTSLRLILVGIGISAFAGACASFISTFGEVAAVQRAMVWLAGSLRDSRWDRLPELIGWMLPACLLIAFGARELDLIVLGDDVARGRGQPVNLVRIALLFGTAMICGAAVAAAGLIAFVGLAAPHIARGLVGQRHAALLPASALTGALLVLAADLIARRALAPVQLPVGIVTAMLGAPFFGVLLWRRRND
ncbi:iron ABC transporter permease [Roseivivax halodurans JCM 10272]|uniref:Iron ABC transporter permease n=1 Tax=Roseivivax halodurans JCM 10272 TaxID=1449350 RepID=X7EC57_9RHOB|nr:iron ABC transporter permease [Roseivivax halodurans]ETX13420.1 iron ABC transporter permease [Roseivivax halodurans JCM 10272]